MPPNTPHVVCSDICTAVKMSSVIGSKVKDLPSFLKVLLKAIQEHDFDNERVPGQALVPLPHAVNLVSAGVGERVEDPDAYCLRVHRGRVGAYLKRKHAAKTESCSAVVYTLDAYLKDPDVTEKEAKRVCQETLDFHGGIRKPTHILVAVLASAGPTSPLSPMRFTHNLAGGNHAAKTWTADEIRAMAEEIMDYDNKWATVADQESL